MASTATREDGLVVTDSDGLQLVSLQARRSAAGKLAARVAEQYGLELPRGGWRAADCHIGFAGIAPGAWLVSRAAAGSLADELAHELGDLAAVVDQSDGLGVVRLTGPSLRELLAKLVPIDVHPAVFASGRVATTMAARIAVTLWRLDDGADGSPQVEIAVARSLAGSFWHALCHNAAEFGGVTKAEDEGAC